MYEKREIKSENCFNNLIPVMKYSCLKQKRGLLKETEKQESWKNGDKRSKSRLEKKGNSESILIICYRKDNIQKTEKRKTEKRKNYER
jgi:hypothetical protein